MLSILIPTFNYNVVPLINELHKQCLECGVEFEILVYDDGSKSILNEENNKINILSYSKFIATSENLGLSINRNNLANDSKYNYLLFIDGDSLLPDNMFIKRYLNDLIKDLDIIYGGRIHPENIENTNQKLRWEYGKQREDLNASTRKKNNYKCVLFNNTIIKRKLVTEIGFNKNLTQYGHEDTLFAYNASLLNVNVLHIDNPVFHNDIDNNDVYISKTLKALENLNLIYKANLIDSKFVTFLKHFNSLKRLKINYILASSFDVLFPLYKIILTSQKPSLIVFDIFRLSYFSKINLKK